MILFLDFDGTICDSSHSKHLYPKDAEGRVLSEAPNHPSWKPWTDAILANSGIPIPKNILQAKEFLKVGTIVLMTARGHALRSTTRDWLQVHCPDLIIRTDSFRDAHDYHPPHYSKVRRMLALMVGWEKMEQYACMDDDPNMKIVESFGIQFIQIERQDGMH